MHAIETQGLTKSYGRRYGIRDLALTVPEGLVFGFLGPNGAGKTTTIRLLLGLSDPSSGVVRIFGREPRRLNPRSRTVGAVLENPGFDPALTATENLEVLVLVSGIRESRLRIPSLLDRVGLADVRGVKVGTYSYGMRQRLALASALVHDPQLVVMDEPMKGLDPHGMRDVRLLIEALRAQGRTVFLSSHLLSEVEHVCDEVAIVRKGSVITQGPLASLRGDSEPEVRIVTDSPEMAEQTLQQRGWITRRENEGLFVRGAKSAEVNRALIDAGLVASDLTTVSRSLEDIFLDIADEPAD